jgi:23S rRNA pseudouridine1911/1915/1917 synthase
MSAPRSSFVADRSDDGKRLDVAVAEHADRSRSACADLIRAGSVLVNGLAAKPAHVVRAGERVDIDLPEPVAPAAQPEPIPIDIVYEDAEICVVDKPAGLATHPAPGSPRGTLVNALLARLGELPAINGVLRPGIVHRLDKDTSGLMVVAKTERSMRSLAHAIAQRNVVREYDAVVWGAPPAASGTIDAPIGRHAVDRKRFAVREDGRRAVTHYRLRERFTLHDPPHRGTEQTAAQCSLLEVRLETGRTHQIRVHCAAVGNPIVGDAVYAPRRPKLGVARQMLHAGRLRFVHPATGEALSFTAPWPADFAGLVARLRSGNAR